MFRIPESLGYNAVHRTSVYFYLTMQHILMHTVNVLYKIGALSSPLQVYTFCYYRYPVVVVNMYLYYFLFCNEISIISALILI